MCGKSNKYSPEITPPMLKHVKHTSWANKKEGDPKVSFFCMRRE